MAPRSARTVPAASAVGAAGPARLGRALSSVCILGRGHLAVLARTAPLSRTGGSRRLGPPAARACLVARGDSALAVRAAVISAALPGAACSGPRPPASAAVSAAPWDSCESVPARRRRQRRRPCRGRGRHGACAGGCRPAVVVRICFGSGRSSSSSPVMAGATAGGWKMTCGGWKVAPGTGAADAPADPVAGPAGPAAGATGAGGAAGGPWFAAALPVPTGSFSSRSLLSSSVSSMRAISRQAPGRERLPLREPLRRAGANRLRSPVRRHP